VAHVVDHEVLLRNRAQVGQIGLHVGGESDPGAWGPWRAHRVVGDGSRALAAEPGGNRGGSDVVMLTFIVLGLGAHPSSEAR
jgi:hypothetical protein